MGKLYNSGSPTSKVYNVSLNAPFDTRLTVQNVADLTNGENGGIASLVYRGMVVYVHQDKSLYIYTGASNGTWKNKNTGKLINGGDINNWKKLIVDPVDALEFYEGIFTKKEELADFLTSSDLEDYVKVEDITNITSGFVSQSDLDVYVKSEDLADFVTSSELDARIAAIDIPEVPKNVSVFLNDAGYLTETDLPEFLLASDLDGYVKTEDLKGYIPMTELERLASKSDLNGYVKTSDAIAYLTASDLEGFATLDKIPTAGSFPAASNIDSSVAPVNGYATVQGVMDYVNALLEKKKDELTDPDYIYVNGVKIEDLNNLPTPTSIYQMNQYEIDKDILTNGLQVLVNKEILGFDGENDPNNSQSIAYSVIFSVNIPTNYSIEIHNWDPEANRWSNVHQLMVPNPRYSTTQYGSRTYNCFVRPTNGDNYYDAVNAIAKYKIVIKKNQ